MMKGWNFLKIKDYPIQIIDGDRGTNYPTKEEFLQDGYCLFLNTGNVTLSGFNFDEKAFITEEKHKKLRKGHLRRCDSVLTTRGTIGNVAFYGDSIPYNLVRINSGMLILRPDQSKLDPCFFYGLLRSSIFQQQADLFRYGAAQPQLPITTLKHIRLPLPPLPIQQMIAGILAAYDDLIENNLKRIKLLEEMAQITYEEWFVRLRFPGHESTPINPETGLPEDWQTKPISTICDINKNFIPVRNTPETIHYIDISSAETGCYATPEEMPFVDAPSRARRRVAFGDTIFSTVRPNRRVFSLVLENDPLLVASTGFAVLTPHRAQNFPFIYLTIAQQSFTDAAVAVAGGAAYPAVNQTDFERIKITVPPQELMNKFSDVFVPNFTIKGQLLRENTLLREARDILLPRLMTGVIDVENYDPARLLKEAA